jgi:hypothetical protein
MNEFEPELFEAELQTLKPAPPSKDFLARLVGAIPPTCASATPQFGTSQQIGGLWRLLRWLTPAAAAGALLAVILFRQFNASADKSATWHPKSKPAESMVKADKVEIDQQLVATFDTVAQLPDGEPVRFRCSEWLDDVVLRDSTRGILIEHRMPHLEIVPVSFEVY